MESSKPYLCLCGSILDVAAIGLGDSFRCPQCKQVQDLDASDPSFLGAPSESDGVYGMLLSKKMHEDSQLLIAESVERDKTTDLRIHGVEDHDQTIGLDSQGDRTPIAGMQETDTPATKGMNPSQNMASPPPATMQTTATTGPNADGSYTPATSIGNGPHPGHLPTGESLGPFRIEGVLGKGGMGTVYEAFDSSLHRTVALKVLAEEHAQNPEVVDRFRREARAAGSLTHPNITHIYSIGESKGIHYFAMELVRGDTLSQILKSEGRISCEVAIEYLLQIAQGLNSALEKKIIHRDIKPSNLILSQTGLVKISDFGLAKVITSSVDITATGVIVGTPLYMSPEQGKGETLDHRSDIYSLGCAFYHLLSGKAPFSGETAMSIIVRHITEEPPTLSRLDGAVGEKLATIIRRMMSKNSFDRYQDYGEVIGALQAAMQAGKVSTTSTSLESVPGRIVLHSLATQESAPNDSMNRKQLSVADVNLELGRFDKALGLYQKVLKDNPELRLDLSFRMLKIHLNEGNTAEALELCDQILGLTSDPAERYYCNWKLLQRNNHSTLAAVRKSRAGLEQTLADDLPEEISSRRLRQRLEDLKQLERDLGRDCEASILLIRRTGDMQIELD